MTMFAHGTQVETDRARVCDFEYFIFFIFVL
jgi:hypothetical protein